MVAPEEVAAMLRLKELGWGSKRISKELGVSRGTVKRYLAAGCWQPFRAPSRKKLLDGEAAWLEERFRRHRGNADVVRQELAAEKGIAASLRTVERAVASHRAELAAEARACVRFETAPGKQLQIDFGERLVEIGGAKVKVYLFVATLGYSRRCHVRAFRHERQESWLDGLESAFLEFGGMPEDVLIDNARALVTSHDLATRTVVFNEKLLAFARHWGFRPKACAPYRARTKGKTERGVGYVKRNAIAGRSFASWEAMEAHLAQWEREIANARVHATTGETPAERFARAEAAALKPLAGRPPFRSCRILARRVKNDCVVEVDGNAYSVPWRLIGETVEVTVAAGQVRVRHGSREVAVHAAASGKRQRVIDAAHLEGVAGGAPRSSQAVADPGDGPPPARAQAPALLRPLAEYEAAVGGGF
ncbi:MAG TPA: IS21 family transposase [Hyphomicrobiaceae bacterium]|nr:IS21 family transposase [Hyphomicrobiaceae bacterium]